MSRLAVLSDIHGDTGTLRRVLRDIDKHDVDAILCLGDVFDCLVSKRDLARFRFERLDQVVHTDRELGHLLADVTVVRGNQEERISALAPRSVLPAWSLEILDAPLSFTTPFGEYRHGHDLPWIEVEPAMWSPLEASFDRVVLTHGHHHRSATRTLPAQGRAWADVRNHPVKVAEPVELSTDRRHLVNVGPCHGTQPAWVLVDEAAATVTHHRPGGSR